jgi:hypothetical protein
MILGPNEVSYCNVDAVASTLGPNGLPKGSCKFRPVIEQYDVLVFNFYIRL